jgi:hypothetical protein
MCEANVGRWLIMQDCPQRIVSLTIINFAGTLWRNGVGVAKEGKLI